MKKSSQILFLICCVCVGLVISFMGCENKENIYGFDTIPYDENEVKHTSANVTEETVNIDKISDDLSMEYYVAGEGMAEKLGVDKTLVFVTDRSAVIGADTRIFEKFNELLVNRYGCDFTVEFHGYRTGLVEDYQKEIRIMKEKNVQTDILYTGPGLGSKGIYTYDDAIKDGLLEPLGTLFKTDNGSKLKEGYHEKIWTRVERNGEYYGFLANSYVTYPYLIIINKKYINNTSEVGSIESFSDVITFLEKVEEIEDGIIPLAVHDTAFNVINGYYDFKYGYMATAATSKGAGIYARKVNGKWEAFFTLEDEEYLNALLNARAYVNGKNLNHENAIRQGKFVVAIAYGELDEFNNNTILIDDDLKGNLYKEMDVFVSDIETGWFEYAKNTVIGIASWSDYKDEVLEFFSLIASEPELSNLLTYGLEGIHYELKEGVVVYKEFDDSYGGVPMTVDSIVNPIITYPVGLEGENKIKRYTELADEADLGLKSLYDIDISEHNEKLEQMAKLMTKYEGWLYEDNYMELLEEQRKQMKELGIDEVVAEINRQLDEAQK